MRVRDEIEAVLRAWDKYETARSKAPVIDFDCCPAAVDPDPAEGRISVYERLHELRRRAAESEEEHLLQRLDSHLAYLRALLGEQQNLSDYIRLTQGCGSLGWPVEYVVERGVLARRAIEQLGIPWGSDTECDLTEWEKPLNADDAPDAIREATTLFEPTIRDITGSDAEYHLSIEAANVDAYWSYWLDGAGKNVRLRLNMRNARFTEVRARQFALHEVLGHGLQSASFAARCAHEDVPWVRLLSVHAPQQVLLEGLAQAWPLFAAPQDRALVTRVRLDHYLQLVRAELHLSINAGVSVAECVRHARSRVPFWSDNVIADILADRGADTLLRSYLWSYPAGLDWFAALADADDVVKREVLHAAYREPLTPDDLSALWPNGPVVGGTGSTLRLRQPSVS